MNVDTSSGLRPHCVIVGAVGEKGSIDASLGSSEVAPRVATQGDQCDTINPQAPRHLC